MVLAVSGYFSGQVSVPSVVAVVQVWLVTGSVGTGNVRRGKSNANPPAMDGAAIAVKIKARLIDFCGVISLILF